MESGFFAIKRGDDFKDDKYLKEIEEKFELDHVTAKIMAERGLDSIKKIDNFLNPKEEDLYDPYLLPDMGKAVGRVISAKFKKEKICVYGDYDVDGTTGIAILLKYFKSINIPATYKVPNRLTEGYGMNIEALPKIKEEDVSLIITVDNGVTCFEQIDWCNENGIDVIVTDHHEPLDRLPNAIAVVDAKRKDSTYPYNEICGAFVALKLAIAVDKALGLNSNFREYYELVSLATVADIVPLKDENRTITKLGINSVNGAFFKSRSLKALKEASNTEYVTAGKYGYNIGPMINAAGRLGHAEQIIEFHLEEDQDKLNEMARLLLKQNKERQDIERGIYDKAVKYIKRSKRDENDIIVVAGYDWHSGVIGIVASKLQDIWYKPTIVVSIDKKTGKGHASCRSIKGFNIFNALYDCKEHLIQMGGHEQAAGFSIDYEKLSDFNNAIQKAAQKQNIKDVLIKKNYYDAEIDPQDISEDMIININQLEPFGIGNPGVKFLSKNVDCTNITKVGTQKDHLSFRGNNIKSIAFGMGNTVDDKTDSFSADLLYKAEINEFNGWKNINLLVSNIHQRTSEK